MIQDDDWNFSKLSWAATVPQVEQRAQTMTTINDTKPTESFNFCDRLFFLFKQLVERAGIVFLEEMQIGFKANQALTLSTMTTELMTRVTNIGKQSTNLIP